MPIQVSGQLVCHSPNRSRKSRALKSSKQLSKMLRKMRNVTALLTPTMWLTQLKMPWPSGARMASNQMLSLWTHHARAWQKASLKPVLPCNLKRLLTSHVTQQPWRVISNSIKSWDMNWKKYSRWIFFRRRIMLRRYHCLYELRHQRSRSRCTSYVRYTQDNEQGEVWLAMCYCRLRT